MNKILDFIRELLEAIFVRPSYDNGPLTHPMNAPDPDVLGPWTTATGNRHNVRVICDQEGLTLEQKNTLCATVGGESGWKPTAIGAPNSNGSQDYGICQINNRLWIGDGKQFPSVDYVLNNPEACIRWMCKQWKAGHRNWWIAYKNGSYKRYL